MPRPFVISVLIFIIFIVAIYELYVKWHSNNEIIQVPTSAKWIGIIDMNATHGINMKTILNGEDALLLLDSANPDFQRLAQSKHLQDPLLRIGLLEIADYDENRDGIIDIQDPIYPFLHILAFNTDGQGHTERTLSEAGIRGIKVQHKTTSESHEVILSDGSLRTLYEINRLGMTSIYNNNYQKILKNYPEMPTKF